MASNIKLKNNLGNTFTLEHSNDTGDVTLTSTQLKNIRQVDTIADLRAMTDTQNTVWVSGYHTKDDGAFGSNIFRWNPTSTEDDNGGTIIKLDSVETGRYELQFDGAVNVKWFGAVGDGVTDDTEAIQEAVNSGAKAVYIPAGTYSVSGAITLTSRTDVRIFGDGFDLTTIKKADAAPTYGGRLFYINNSTNITIEELFINGNGSNQTAYDADSSIEVWGNSKNITLKNIRIDEALRYGVYFKGDTTSGIPLRCVIDNLRTSNSLGTDSSGTEGALGRTGCAIIAANQIEVKNCVFQDLFDVEPNTSSQFATGRITNNVFYAGADFGFNSSGAVYDMPIISGNTFYANSNRTATIQLYGGVFQNNTITNYIGQTQITGNHIGIATLENNGGYYQIIGNRILGHSVGIAIGILNSGSLISDNYIQLFDTTTSTLTSDSKTFNYGGIVTATNSPIRGGTIHNNKVSVYSAFSTAGGYAIDSQAINVRTLSLVGNHCYLSDTYQSAKMYAVVTRNYADRIASNDAIVNTSLTGTNYVREYSRNRFVLESTDRYSAPSGGTYSYGDVAWIGNARSSASPAEAHTHWYYTVDAGWKTAGVIS